MKHFLVILTIFFDMVMFLATFYVVFFMHYSGWWFLMTILLCVLESTTINHYIKLLRDRE